MQHFQIVMALVRQGNGYVLQLRNGKNQSGGLNLIGCFGGQIEPGETPEQALVRELAEESNVHSKVTDLQYFGEVRVDSERHDQPITVHSRIYRLELPESVKIEAQEGQLIRMTTQEVRANLDKLTPATKACFEQLIKE